MLWVWKNSREMYVCKLCLTKVKWNSITHQGKCNCTTWYPNEPLTSEIPPQHLKDGHFESYRDVKGG